MFGLLKSERGPTVRGRVERLNLIRIVRKDAWRNVRQYRGLFPDEPATQAAMEMMPFAALADRFAIDALVLPCEWPEGASSVAFEPKRSARRPLFCRGEECRHLGRYRWRGWCRIRIKGTLWGISASRKATSFAVGGGIFVRRRSIRQPSAHGWYGSDRERRQIRGPKTALTPPSANSGMSQLNRTSPTKIHRQPRSLAGLPRALIPHNVPLILMRAPPAPAISSEMPTFFTSTKKRASLRFPPWLESTDDAPFRPFTKAAPKAIDREAIRLMRNTASSPWRLGSQVSSRKKTAIIGARCASFFLTIRIRFRRSTRPSQLTPFALQQAKHRVIQTGP